MKNSKINCRATINRFILLSLTLCYISTAYCSNKEQEIKQFLIYDAMSYIGKPDLSYYGLQPVYLMYEVTLTKKITPIILQKSYLTSTNREQANCILISENYDFNGYRTMVLRASLTDQEIEQRFDTLLVTLDKIFHQT